MEITSEYDVIVIGSGPGGYVGAIRAAQLGLRTAVVEKNPTLGGTCLNVGCIPSKALLESSEQYLHAINELDDHGIKTQGVTLDLHVMMGRKDKIVKELTTGIAFLMKKNKITVYHGLGKITQPNIVEVQSADGKVVTLASKNIVIATGSVPSELPFLKCDETRILSSTGALALNKIPETMVVVGGGVIGLELGSVWHRLGTKVTVVEYSDRLCGTTDKECVQVLQRHLTKEGMKFLLSTKVVGVTMNSQNMDLHYESLKNKDADSSSGKTSTQDLRTEVILVATGRKPFTGGLGCEELGIEKDQMGRIKTDGHYQTNIKGIYAIGDVIHGPMLAHKAEEEGVALAEILAGKPGHVNYLTVPGVIYTHPEIASVGLTEEQAAAANIAVKVGKFPFTANGRAKALGFTEGFCKIVAEDKTDRLLGGHIVGPRASELLGEIVVAMEFAASSEDLARSFHSHPTLTEVIREAALAVDKRARQM